MAGRCFEKCALPASDHVANLSTLQSQPCRACTVCTMCHLQLPRPSIEQAAVGPVRTFWELFFCEEVMLGLLSCVNLYLLWVWTDTFWPCMAMYFWFPYQCYLRQTQSCFSRRPSYLREKFKNIPFSWVHPVWGIVEEVHWRQVSTCFSTSVGTLQLNNQANWMSLIGYSLGKAYSVLRTGICWISSNLNHLT